MGRKLDEVSEKELKCLHINARSLINKTEKLELLKQDMKLDVTGITMMTGIQVLKGRQGMTEIMDKTVE